jgi:hypothetical protein
MRKTLFYIAPMSLLSLLQAALAQDVLSIGEFDEREPILTVVSAAFPGGSSIFHPSAEQVKCWPMCSKPQWSRSTAAQAPISPARRMKPLRVAGLYRPASSL